MTTIFEHRSKTAEYELIEYEPDETLEVHDTTIVQHQEMTPELRKQFEEAYHEACARSDDVSMDFGHIGGVECGKTAPSGISAPLGAVDADVAEGKPGSSD